MKTIQKKTIVFEDVIAETEEERKDIERIINEVKKEDQLPIDLNKLKKGIPTEELES